VAGERVRLMDAYMLVGLAWVVVIVVGDWVVGWLMRDEARDEGRDRPRPGASRDAREEQG
jgi:hypothetical protein